MFDAAIAESNKETTKSDRAARLAEEQTYTVIAARSNSTGSSNADPYAAFKLLRRHRPPVMTRGRGRRQSSKAPPMKVKGPVDTEDNGAAGLRSFVNLSI